MHQHEIDDEVKEFESLAPKNYPNEKALYKGDLVNDKREGRGLQIWKDGTVYMGEWRNDKINGKGKIISLSVPSSFLTN